MLATIIYIYLNIYIYINTCPYISILLHVTLLGYSCQSGGIAILPYLDPQPFVNLGECKFLPASFFPTESEGVEPSGRGSGSGSGTPCFRKM